MQRISKKKEGFGFRKMNKSHQKKQKFYEAKLQFLIQNFLSNNQVNNYIMENLERKGDKVPWLQMDCRLRTEVRVSR